MSIREYKGHWCFYKGNLWHSGWSIINVTYSSAPYVVKFIPGPENTFTLQMELSDNIMITTWKKDFQILGKFRQTAWWRCAHLWCQWSCKSETIGAVSYWRNRYTSKFLLWNSYAHLAAGMPGYKGNIYVIIDICNQTQPLEVGRWWVPDRHTASWEKPSELYIPLHGPPCIVTIWHTCLMDQWVWLSWMSIMYQGLQKWARWASVHHSIHSLAYIVCFHYRKRTGIC
jgi:hypothetical protein